jgi:hypothetical protein
MAGVFIPWPWPTKIAHLWELNIEEDIELGENLVVAAIKARTYIH